MAGQANRLLMRGISLFVLVTFTASLFAPALRAQQTASSGSVSSDTSVMTNNAKVALSDLWYAWVKQGGSSTVKPDRQFAFNFFKAQGADTSQAELLTNNAQSAGQLSTQLPSSESGLSAIWKKISGVFDGQSAQEATQTDTSSSSGSSLLDRLKGLSGGTNQTVHESPSTQSGLGDKVHEGLNQVGEGIQRVGQKVAGVGHDISSGLTTALLTTKDQFDIRQFYNIPISQTQGLKVTGGSQYDVKFTDGGWVNQEVSSSVDLVEAINADEAMKVVGQLQTQAGPAEAGYSGLGSITSKFSEALTNFKNKITGSSEISEANAQELGQLKIESNLLEHAQGLTQAQNAIQVRIDKLTADAARLGREVPEAEIANLKKTYDAIEGQKTDLVEKLKGVQESSAQSVVSSGMKWALYSVGMQASVNVIKQVLSGQKVDVSSALSFVGQPSFWSGTAGSFLGSLVFSNLASSLIPGGGIFMRILPGFLGSALGYEAGASLFGGGSGDWMGTIGQSMASAGGYALAYSLLGGAMAPGIALIGAGIAAGALFNFFWAKLKGGEQGSGSGDGSLPSPDVGSSNPQPQTPPSSGAQPSTGASGNIDSAMRTMQQAYTEYINFLKDGKVTDAKQAFDRYMKSKDALDAARRASAEAASASIDR